MNPTARRLTTAAAIVATLLLSATSCLPVDYAGPEMTIVNQTEHRLIIHIGDSERSHRQVGPDEVRRFPLTGTPGDCTEWILRVVTEDGTRTATNPAPQCDGDEWTITDADLHPVTPDR